ncbi:protein of unknown function (plasmid) [Cupriavidus taiwanensis]|nr:protein of unknown function [Cupriavidus taiwanensis]
MTYPADCLAPATATGGSGGPRCGPCRIPRRRRPPRRECSLDTFACAAFNDVTHRATPAPIFAEDVNCDGNR